LAQLVKVGNVDEVPNGKMKGFVVNGKKLLVANINNKYYAISSECTHMGGPLEKGSLSSYVVTCPWHGSKFDVTSGKVVGPPAKKDETKYEVKIKGKEIFVSF
jgi:nitrite reductase/ring-hydroxylating ferredoxin subunit